MIKFQSCRYGDPYHKDHHKGKKEAFSDVMREAPIFPNYCMENSEICPVRLARSISLVFYLISLCIERRLVLLLCAHVWMKVKHCHKCNTNRKTVQTWLWYIQCTTMTLPVCLSVCTHRPRVHMRTQTYTQAESTHVSIYVYVHQSA